MAWGGVALAVLAAAGVGAQERVLGAALEPEVIRRRLAEAPVTRFRPVGRQSLVLEMRLDGAVDGLWVPETREDPNGWRHEVAAYRIARCLGMDNVPPAVVREVRRDTFADRFDPAFDDVRDAVDSAITWSADGVARGAAVYLPRDARASGLTLGRRMDRRLRGLAQGSPSEPARRTLHADLAHSILFDYLIARPGRLAPGASLPSVPSGQRLFLLDQSAAFGASTHEALRGSLHRVEKIAPWFATGLARCDEQALASMMREPRAGGSLLGSDPLERLLDRRRTLVSWVVALLDAHGADAVLVLP